MRILLIILIIIFNLTSFTKADDIRDFEIEGISVEDSLLDFFSEEKIINSEKTIYPGSKNFYTIHIVVDSQNYDQISIGVKNNDKNYTVYNIAGDKFYEQNPKNCLPQMENVVNQFDEDFKAAFKDEYKYTYTSLAKGKSYAEIVDYNFPNNSAIRVWCSFYTEEVIEKFDVANGLTVSIGTNKWFNFLNTEAY
tara:strand:- start:29 stop:610 length:582 start_codon:yes stop_codon:yes gene_type:complete